MDVKRIGEFLAQLRKEQGITQEQLGEKLGVTNKTVSRWENGNYLPPVEMLQLLSDMYGLTINEILSGQRLNEEDYKCKAEENIKSALDNSAFTLKDKIEYYKKKWLKEHLLSSIFMMLPAVGFLIAGGLKDDTGFTLLGFFMGLVNIIVRRNEMMTYIESHAYDGSGRQ